MTAAVTVKADWQPFLSTVRKWLRGRVEKTVPAVYSADETADVGLDEATQSADLVFEDVEDSEFTGFVKSVTISIPEG